MSIITDYLADIILAIGLAAFLVSVMTQVTKRLAFMNKVPTDLQIVILSLVISFVGFLAYASYSNMVITWYYIAGVFFGAFIVAFVSMYGWSKLKSIYGRLVTNSTGTETGTTAADTAAGTGITTATNTAAGTGTATATNTAAVTGTTTATNTAAGTGITTTTDTAAGTGTATAADTTTAIGTAAETDTTTATDTAAETNTSTEAASSDSGGDTQAK
jgi:hypothetical protein